jgi:CubicO group peptidase (beta-lactamase class C family)
MKSRLSIMFMLCLLQTYSVTLLSCGTDARVRRIDEIISAFYENGLFNGAVLVAYDGDVLYKKAFGLANLDDRVPLQLSTPSCIGSVSKQFTSMAIMILKEQGKLSYDSKLADYYPGIPGSSEISIRHLLTHTSGLPRGKNTTRSDSDGMTNEDMLDWLMQLDSLEFVPGSSYSYSNSGYIVLAMIVEQVSGMSYPEFLRQHIFEPLGMDNSFVADKAHSDAPDRAIGYNLFGDVYDYNVFLYGPGGVYSTVEDLLKWDQGLCSNLLVSRETLEEGFRPALLSDGSPTREMSDSTWGDGFGWLLRRNASEHIVWHDGGYNGFSAILYRELNSKLCIALIANRGQMGSNAPVYPVHNALLQVLNGLLYELPQMPIAVKFQRIIEDGGLDAAVEAYHDLKGAAADKYDFAERELNGLGYYYLSKERFDLARGVFGLNVAAFPNSANAYDSYAEACMLDGRIDEAVQNYERSLELNPENANAVEMLKRLRGDS